MSIEGIKRMTKMQIVMFLDSYSEAMREKNGIEDEGAEVVTFDENSDPAEVLAFFGSGR